MGRLAVGLGHHRHVTSGQGFCPCTNLHDVDTNRCGSTVQASVCSVATRHGGRAIQGEEHALRLGLCVCMKTTIQRMHDTVSGVRKQEDSVRSATQSTAPGAGQPALLARRGVCRRVCRLPLHPQVGFRPTPPVPAWPATCAHNINAICCHWGGQRTLHKLNQPLLRVGGSRYLAV